MVHKRQVTMQVIFSKNRFNHLQRLILFKIFMKVSINIQLGNEKVLQTNSITTFVNMIKYYKNSNFLIKDLIKNRPLKMIAFRCIFLRLITFISSVLTLISTQYTQVDPQWVTNNYFRANNEPVINSLTGSTTTPQFTFIFSSALSGIPNLAYGIKGYKGNDYLGQQYFEIKRIDLTTSTFTVAIQIFQVTNIWILNVAYIAVDPLFPHHLNIFDNVPVNYSQGSLQNITVQTDTQTTYQNIINYTLQSLGRIHTVFSNPLSSNKVLFFLTSLFVNSYKRSATTLYPSNISISYGIMSQTTYFVKVIVLLRTAISRMHFSEIIFNYDDVLASNKYQLVQTVWYTDKNGDFMHIEQQFTDNFIMGLMDFTTIDGWCGINYRWQFQTDSNGQFGVKMYQSDFWHVWDTYDGCALDTMRSTVFYLKTWQCPQTHLFYNLTSNKCQDLCGNRHFENVGLAICQNCHYSCLKCLNNNVNSCTSCDSSDHRVLTQSNSCECSNGYYQDGQNSVCLSCLQISAGCIECSLNTSFNGAGWQFLCTNCDASSGLFINSVSNQCQQCQIVGCVQCTTLSQCSICDTNSYYLDLQSGSCNLNSCGDKILSGLQQCDDGNTLSGDGCSASCQIQDFWVCPIYYCCSLQQNTISLSLIRYEKILDKNQFRIFVNLQSQMQNLYFYQHQIKKPKKIETSPLGGKVTYFLYDSVKKNIQISLLYNKSLGFPFQIVILYEIPLSRADCNQNLFNARLIIDTFPGNSLPPVFYQQEEYKKQKAVSQFMFAMAIILWFLMIWSIFTGRIVGLELFGVFQLAFLDLTNHNQLNLMLTGLLKIGFVNGLNLNQFFQLSQSEQNLPSRIRQINYSSSFIYNCNIMLFLHIAIMFIGGILYVLINRFSHRLQKVKLFKSLIKQIMVTFTLFVCLNLAFTIGLNFKYGQSHNQILWAADMLLIILEFGFFLIIMAMIVSGSKHLGQFLNKFKKDKASKNYIAITLLYRIIIGFYIAFNNQSEISTLIILILVILYLIYHFAHLPFKSTLHNYRSSICHISTGVILYVTMFYRSMMSSTNIDERSRIFNPAYIQLAMLFICLFISFISLAIEAAKQIYKKFVTQKQVSINENTTSNQTLENMQQKQSENTNNFVFVDFQ